MGIAIAMRLAHLPDFTLTMNKNLLAAVIIPLIIEPLAAQVFYTYDGYNEILEKETGRRMHVLLLFDPYFLQKINSDIGANRKMAGYLYAVSKIVAFGCIGVKLGFVTVSHLIK